MAWVRSACIALSMFSKIPVPTLEWDEKSLRWVMAFFPLVGAVVGLAFFTWNALCLQLQLGPFLRGAGFAVLPLWITGGIHMDGFCDTVDAVASRASKEKKLEILADPHLGAFAAIWACVYILAFAALASELGTDRATLACAALLFVLSRSLSALAVLLLPGAKSGGLAHTFSQGALQKPVVAALLVLVGLLAALLLFFGRVAGGVMLAGAALVLFYYRRLALRSFGGITGDLAGWFLQMCELVLLAGLVFAGKG